MPYEPRYRTMADLFERSVEAYGPRELFGTKKGGAFRYVTYAEVGALVRRFRAGLAQLGVGRDDRVAIITDNRVEWAVAAYACYGLGAALVPMYEAQNPAEWEFIVRDCGAKVAIVAGERVLAKAGKRFDGIAGLQKVVQIDGGSDGQGRVVSFVSLLGFGERSATPPPEPRDVATILYTSGTTGNPKGVVLTHENLATNASAAHELFAIVPADRSLSFLPWAHAFGQTAELHTLISCGASMALCEGVDRLLPNLAEVRPTILCCVPTIFARIYTAVTEQLKGRPSVVRNLVSMALAARSKELRGERIGKRERLAVALVDALVFKKVRARLGGRLRFAISGGAALAREVADFVQAIGIVVYEGYGLTETSPVASANAPGRRRAGSVGLPIPGVRIEIDPSAVERETDANGHVEGEVVIFGPNVMKEYFRHPDETAAVLTASGGFRSGDIGYLDRDGYLFISGRIKEKYKLENGKYVVPIPLEDRLKLSPYVANAMVYGDNRPYNVALIVPNQAALQKWAEANQVALPSRVEELSSHPRVRELMSDEMKAHSADIRGFERIHDFALVADFTVENGMLTPKMSLRRRKVIDAHSALLEQMYAGAKSGQRASTSTPSSVHG